MSSRKIVVHDLVRDFRNKLRKEIFEITTTATTTRLHFFKKDFLVKWSQVASMANNNKNKKKRKQQHYDNNNKIMAKLSNCYYYDSYVAYNNTKNSEKIIRTT